MKDVIDWIVDKFTDFYRANGKWDYKGMILHLAIIIIVVMFLSSCAYPKLYAQYTNHCDKPQNQKVLKVGNVEIPQGCNIAPPQDADAKWVGAGGSIGGAVISEVGASIRAKEARKQNETLYKEFGSRVEGDGNVFGDGSSRDVIDQTAQPPAPTVVEPVVVDPVVVGP